VVLEERGCPGLVPPLGFDEGRTAAGASSSGNDGTLADGVRPAIGPSADARLARQNASDVDGLFVLLGDEISPDLIRWGAVRTDDRSR
jgi:hypothetical protein